MDHKWMTYEDAFPNDPDFAGDTDVYKFAFTDGDIHNGPKCVECGRGGCHHCNPEIWTEECLGK